MINFKAFLLLIIVFLTGCSAAPAPSTTGTASYSPTPLIRPEESPSTAAPAIYTPAPPAQTASPMAANLNVKCAEVGQAWLSNSDMEDSSLLLQEDSNGQVYFLDINSNEKHWIDSDQNEILSDFSISPDGKRLALIRSKIEGITTKSSHMEIRSPDGQILETIPIDIDLFISRWLDHEQIVLRRGLEPSSPQIVLNTITKTQQNLNTDFVDLYDMPPTSDWEKQGMVVYDPSLTRVIYAGAPADLVLNDVRYNRNITRISPAPVVHSVPKWSPDGQQAVFTYADIGNPVNDPDHWRFEIYSLSRDGERKQLTNLSESYNYPHMPYYKWSPDGRQIAFWLETAPLQDPGLFDFSVLDLATGRVTNYCIQSAAKGMPEFFWSPDSEHVILETFEANDERTHQVVLLDIEKGRAARIGENLTPLGWLAAP